MRYFSSISSTQQLLS